MLGGTECYHVSVSQGEMPAELQWESSRPGNQFVEILQRYPLSCKSFSVVFLISLPLHVLEDFQGWIQKHNVIILVITLTTFLFRSHVTEDSKTDHMSPREVYTWLQLT